MIPRWTPKAALLCALVALPLPGRADVCGSGSVCSDAISSIERLRSAQINLRNAAEAATNSPSTEAEQALERARNNYAAAKKDSDDRMAGFKIAAAGMNFYGADQVREHLAPLLSKYENELRDIEGRAARDTAGSGVLVPPDVEDHTDKHPLQTSDQSPTVRAASQSIGSGDPAGAEKLLTQALAKDQGDPAALAMRAQARMTQGNREGALDDARQALKGNPNDKASRALVSELESLARASGKIKGNKIDFGAERAPEGDMNGGRPGARAGGGGASPSRAAAPAAGPATAAAIVAAPPAVRGLIERAQQLIGIGDFTGAMLPLREAVDLDPRRPELWDMLAEISNKTGNYKGALAAAESALKLDPSDARALRAKSYAEFQLGDYAAARADADRAVQLDPANGLGYLYRAMAEEKLGDREKALADYRKAEQLDPTVAGLADEGIKRLGGASAPAAPGSSPRRTLLRGGAVAMSTLLIVLGLMGTAAGRRLTTRGWKSQPPAPDGAGAAETVAIGARLGGNYRVTRELGRGGMGVVYQAYDETLQREVAIKQLQRDGRTNPEDLERFLKEARLVAQMKHPHLAQIHTVINEGDLLLVFEYVEGQTLDRILSAEKKFSPEKTTRLVGEICDALGYAHGRKIIHRDLKPSNVMIDAAGRVKVMDFGIAHQSRGDASQTKTSASGTPPYMAPEQALGSVSKSADLYALAVMTYEMLTGVRPFSGPDFLEPKLRGQFVPATSVNPGLPPPVDGFFARALDPDPTKRHADAAEFARALNESLDAAANRA